MSKRYREMQAEGTKKWYNLWVKCADDLQTLSVSEHRDCKEGVDKMEAKKCIVAARTGRGRVDGAEEDES